MKIVVNNAIVELLILLLKDKKQGMLANVFKSLPLNKFYFYNLNLKAK